MFEWCDRTRGAGFLYGKIHSSTIIRRFGDWQRALELAELAYKYSGPVVSVKQRQQQAKRMTDEEIINELRRVAALLKQDTISVEDLRKYSKTLGGGIVNRRFGSWTVGMQKAGLKVSEMYRRKYSDEEYF